MTFLLDTNAVSEWRKPRPDPGLTRWLGEVDELRVFISVATIAELGRGIERLPAGKRRDYLDDWLVNEIPSRFERRILPVDEETADRWGRMTARGQAKGHPVEAIDALLAATAEVHDLTLVSRNVSDFKILGIRLINPWFLS